MTAPRRTRSRLPRGLSAFKHRNYRLFYFGQLISVTGTWMQTLAQSWLVLTMTSSAFLLGLVSVFQFAPMLVLGLFAGLVPDRGPKRRLLVGTQAVAAVLAGTLAVLTFTDTVQLWQIYLLGFLLGVNNAFDMPTRQAFVVEMVGKADAPNAIALTSSLFNAAHIVMTWQSVPASALERLTVCWKQTIEGGQRMAGIAIHGFGRIGRSTLKAALRDERFVPVSISDIRDTQTFAALFKADTNYGLWPEDVRATGDGFTIGGREIRYVNSMDDLPDWSALGVELVIDCTGRATTREGALAHLDRGAQRVLVSAPSKTLDDCDAVLLPGVNLDQFDPRNHKIISMASCTTNSMATIIKLLLEDFALERGFFTTIHAYTNTQALTDQPMKDRRDSWAAAENIIPSSSGAAKALQLIWPNLNITGKAYRVPARTGSIAELNAVLDRPTTVGALRDAFRAAASGPMAGVLDVLEEEWTSARIIGDPHAALVDLPLIQVLDGTLITVASWYDNEMGYSSQLAATAARLAATG